MAKVLITFFGHLRTVVGLQSEYVSGSTFYEVIKKLSEKYGEKLKTLIMQEDGKLKINYVVSINGKNVNALNAHDIKLSDGDFISIFPPVGGG